MAKYKYIEQAESLKLAKDKLEAWRKLDYAAKKAAYATQVTALGGKRVNVGKQTGYITPFGVNDKLFFKTKVLALPTDPNKTGEESETAMITTLTGLLMGTDKRIRLEAPTAAGNVIVKARRVPFARVLYTDVKGNSKATTSRVTGLPYYYTETSTVSTPYGALNATDSEPVARASIETALKAAAPNNRVGFRSQGTIG